MLPNGTPCKPKAAVSAKRKDNVAGNADLKPRMDPAAVSATSRCTINALALPFYASRHCGVLLADIGAG